jgi:hypothetical protein
VRSRTVEVSLGKERWEASYIFREAGFNTTSLGISPSGVLVDCGGVLMNGGGNPDIFAGKALIGVGVLAAVAPGSKPEARNLSSKELGSGTGVADAADVGGALNGS